MAGTTSWIQHVKAYHAKHGVSFKAALKAAAKTWEKKQQKLKKKRKNN